MFIGDTKLEIFHLLLVAFFVSLVMTAYITDCFRESNSPLTTTFSCQFLCYPLICPLLNIDRDQPNLREKIDDFTAEFLKCVKFHGKFTERVSEIQGPHRRYFEVLR